MNICLSNTNCDSTGSTIVSTFYDYTAYMYGMGRWLSSNSLGLGLVSIVWSVGK